MGITMKASLAAVAICVAVVVAFEVNDDARDGEISALSEEDISLPKLPEHLVLLEDGKGGEKTAADTVAAAANSTEMADSTKSKASDVENKLSAAETQSKEEENKLKGEEDTAKAKEENLEGKRDLPRVTRKIKRR